MLQETILRRAADLAEALYSMPRNQLSFPPPSQGSPMNGTSAFNCYTGQLSVNVKDANTHWDEGWSHRYPAVAF